MRGCAEGTDNGPQYEYTLMPTRMRGFMTATELANWEPAGAGHGTPEEDFSFLKGYRVMKVPSRFGNFGTGRKVHTQIDAPTRGTMLYDVLADPLQDKPLG